jgi:hypothetical protein
VHTHPWDEKFQPEKTGNRSIAYSNKTWNPYGERVLAPNSSLSAIRIRGLGSGSIGISPLTPHHPIPSAPPKIGLEGGLNPLRVVIPIRTPQRHLVGRPRGIVAPIACLLGNCRLYPLAVNNHPPIEKHKIPELLPRTNKSQSIGFLSANPSSRSKNTPNKRIRSNHPITCSRSNSPINVIPQILKSALSPDLYIDLGLGLSARISDF